MHQNALLHLFWTIITIDIHIGDDDDDDDDGGDDDDDDYIIVNVIFTIIITSWFNKYDDGFRWCNLGLKMYIK